MQSYEKDPDAKLDYSINWAAWLGVDTISVSTWIADTGITIAGSPAPSNTATVATVWLSGGTLGGVYNVVNRITTAAGRIQDATLVIQIAQR